MRMTDYIQAREDYLETRVYLQLADTLNKAGLDDDGGRSLVASAFAEGKLRFERAQASVIGKALVNAGLPDAKEAA